MSVKIIQVINTQSTTVGTVTLNDTIPPSLFSRRDAGVFWARKRGGERSRGRAGEV